jgi:hypothetical protein
MNWLVGCLINLWRLTMPAIKFGVSPISIKEQINLIENKIRVLKAMKNVKMVDVVEGRVPIYEAVLKTLRGVVADG